MKKNKYKNLMGILTLPLLLCVGFFAFAGNYIFPTIVFPVGIFGLLVPQEISAFFFLTGLFQFVIYGFFMDRFGVKKVLPFIIVIHLVLVGIAFFLKFNFD
jgi:MFS family permease